METAKISGSVVAAPLDAATPLEFTHCHDYTTFSAQHAFKGADLVFHFYRTSHCPEEQYWIDTFPEALDEVARLHYGDFPRVRAALTRIPNERTGEFLVDSWWLEARGFSDVGLPLKKIEAFYEALDAALEKRISR